MLCFIALFVFAVLALFSARYRPLALEAFDCVFRKATFRKCSTGLDKRVKAAVSGRLMRRHPRAARFVYRHMEFLSWILVILTILSAYYVVDGAINYYRFGNCNGPENSGEFCIFDPTGRSSQYSGVDTGYEGDLLVPGVDDDPSIGPADASVVVIEFGCYICPFTRSAQPAVERVLDAYEGRIRFVYRDFPLDGLEEALATSQVSCEVPEEPSWLDRLRGIEEEPEIKHPGSTRASVAANCALDEGLFWEYHGLILAAPEKASTKTGLVELAVNLGIDSEAFEACIDSRTKQEEVRKDFEEGVAAGIFGTPTFFVNGKRFVAPSEEELRRAIDAALAAG
ncbi:MAG: thioredoxin domain-containing protein [Nitrosarchaeum sp.]|nr:thioredoxin domain-containing protein [Nitrosarchaeum sp.]